MLVLELFDTKLDEMAERMSDIITARELIGSAKSDPHTNHRYFDFLNHLRKKHGPKYSTEIHKEAAKLSHQGTA